MAGDFPIIAGFSPGGTVGWCAGKPVSAERFCAAALELAARLPPKSHVLNLCGDRLNFMLAFTAALIARQVSLLPYSKAPGVIRDLYAGHPDSYCLADASELPSGLPAIMVPPWSAGHGAPDVPQIPGDQVALIAFTSGSTGRPQAHVKTWGSLVRDGRSLGSVLGISPEGACSIVGTVPPQHVYGLETTVMLPLQNGAATHSACPLLPADIVAALAGLPGNRWLATTPIHLRGCVAEEASFPQLAGIVCATMPLASELARQTESVFAAPLHEIYGCTEAGAVALRRPVLTEHWRLRPGMRMWQKGDETWVEGNHLPQPLRLPDRLELVSASEFSLLGRPGDMAKIAGKRVSIEALNRELLRVPGVRDGVFFVPAGVVGSEGRLAALVVAPNREADAILRALRARIDPAFLPRPLLIVDALPRTATGKLTREGLLALAAAAQARNERSA